MSKPDLEKLITDSQAYCDATGSFALVLKCAEISKQRDELKAEMEALNAENMSLQKMNLQSTEDFEELKTKYGNLVALHDVVEKENQSHRAKYNELKVTTKKLNDKVGELKNKNPEADKTRIARLEAENKALAQKYNEIYAKNERLVLVLQVQAKKIDTFEAIEKLILDQRNVDEKTEKSPLAEKSTPEVITKKESDQIEVKKEHIGMPNIPTSTSSVASPRKKALVTNTYRNFVIYIIVRPLQRFQCRSRSQRFKLSH